MEQAVGHVDFYPNGGSDQPGCSLLDLPVDINSMVDNPDRTADSVSRHLVACSHTRAIDFYIESLNTEQECMMIGHECASYEEFEMVRIFFPFAKPGNWTRSRFSGHVLRVREEQPALRHDGVQVHRVQEDRGQVRQEARQILPGYVQGAQILLS